ncbi:hypothetical protein B0H66DRAFT_581114 [Apodospora peruviana]|uniref:Uncharacterized protein n=1 Tax=Apodospora peruviana TaxID=516989 RepID=A0AAE0MBY0_9PEZI|nr:hypothetical protein B0H66DRAFT_581114 [Apodospora peruviana]
MRGLLHLICLATPCIGIKFSECKNRTLGILERNLTYNDINRVNIDGYLYRGPVYGMNQEYARANRTNFTDYPTLNLQGCKAICNDPVQWYWNEEEQSVALSVVSNWVLPIVALLAALPYDSLHGRGPDKTEPWYRGRVFRTLGALCNWLGSPQTALTATLFNIHQMRACLRATRPSGRGIAGNGDLERLKMDAYYVLSCLGQFQLSEDPSHVFLEILAYGLFRPIVGVGGEAGFTPKHPEVEGRVEDAETMTTELLREMAFHLRMLRRRGVYPAMINVLVFFIAFAVSLVLAFRDVGEATTGHVLTLGVLVSWLPLLVLFTILDRNPVSADRSRKLLSRWMWNVNAVRLWARGESDNQNWWSQANEDRRQNAWEEAANDDQRHDDNHELVVNGGGEEHLVPFNIEIGEFIGQGRRLGYNGFAYAVLGSVYAGSGDQRRMRPLGSVTEAKAPKDMAVCAKDWLRTGRKRLRPGSWWLLAFTSLALVWLFVGMAIMMSYNTPTVGLACRSGVYLLYGLLSTFTWVVRLFPASNYPRFWLKVVCHCVNVLTTLVLFFTVFATFSGIYQNCVCQTGISGYMDFEDARFYRDPNHFDVEVWWKRGAIVAGIPLLICSIISIALLRSLKPLWRASEQQNPPTDASHANMIWLI